MQDISNETRKGDKAKNGATLKLHVSFLKKNNDDKDNKSTLSLVIKQVTPSGLELSRNLGLAREALFFNRLASVIPTRSNSHQGAQIPKVYYAYGDMKGGSKVVLMEDLSHNYIDSGILFGPGNPNNWKRNLHKMLSEAYPDSALPPPSSFVVANQTFLAMAQVHAVFWKDPTLLNPQNEAFLRCADWVQGKNQSTWEGSQGFIQGIWQRLVDQDQLDKVLQWDPLVRAKVAGSTRTPQQQCKHQEPLDLGPW